MEDGNIQILFFQHIKALLPPHVSLVDELSELLGISVDSTYRRVRGEKPLTLEEVRKLAAHFKLSVDQLLNLKSSDAIVFSGKYITPANFDFGMYLQQMLKDLTFVNSFKNRWLIYYCRDIVVYYYFTYPELAAFKNYAWMKTMFQFPALAHESFHADIFEKEVFDTCVKIARQYTMMPGSEIMNVNNIHTTLNQIEYYKTARMFRSEDELKIIYKQLHDMIDHIEAQAESGVKFMPGEKENSQSPEYKLYVNSFVTGDNSHFVIMEGGKASFMVHCHVNYLSTTDERHTNYQYNFLNNVMNKSILLSKSGEQLRSGFFYLIHEEIEKSRTNQMKTFGKY
jgi:BetR domain